MTKISIYNTVQVSHNNNCQNTETIMAAYIEYTADYPTI